MKKLEEMKNYEVLTILEKLKLELKNIFRIHLNKKIFMIRMQEMKNKLTLT